MMNEHKGTAIGVILTVALLGLLGFGIYSTVRRVERDRTRWEQNKEHFEKRVEAVLNGTGGPKATIRECYTFSTGQTACVYEVDINDSTSQLRTVTVPRTFRQAVDGGVP